VSEPVVPITPAPPSAVARFFGHVRDPKGWLRGVVDDGPIYAIVVLFGLNAVDELDRSAFNILLPNIRDEFGLSLQNVLSIVGVIALAALLLQVPVALLADQRNRVRLAWMGGAVWGTFSLLTGLAPTIVLLALARSGSALGKAVIDPTHNSLIADYYKPATRVKVYSVHRAANAVGAFIGPLVAGFMAYAWGWRSPFILFAVPTFVFVVMAWKLKEPVRGGHERRAMGATEEAIAIEEDSPSFAEGWRLVWQIPTLKRIWYSLPFLAASLIGFGSLAGLMFEQVFGFDERARGVASAATEPMQLVGLVLGARYATKLLAKGPEAVLGFLSRLTAVVSVALIVFALAPNAAVAIAANMVINGVLAMLGPGILATLSLCMPPRARSIGFSVGSLWIIPGLLILPIIGAIGDKWNIRYGMLVMVPIFFIGGIVITSSKKTIGRDITEVWKASAARSEALVERAHGRSKLLLIRGVEVSYGNVQVLFGVDLEVTEGDIIALLGTNGAGKSTLLNAISGVTEANRGAIIFDGRDITHAPPNEIAAMGIIQVPGGKGVFPSLSVGENLRLAAWMHRKSGDSEDALARVRELFPILRQREKDPAGNLSGGQQQMLALGMAFLSKPRLLMIDELSLGLAPVIVAQMLPVIEEFRQQGTTVILVEQSVNVALDVAHTAYFLEKGEVRFSGPTAELLERPDILRSVFIEGAGAVVGPAGVVTDVHKGDPAAVAAPGNGQAPVNGVRPVGTGSPGAGAAAPVGGNGAAAAGMDAADPSVPGDGDGSGPADGADGADDEPVVAAAAAAAHTQPAVPVREIVTERDTTGVPALRTQEVSVSFGGIRAVDRVSISVQPNEILGILGPNGAGKTTLFDLLSGFVPVASGCIMLGKADVTHLGADGRARKGLGRSFQDARLFPAMTVEEAIAVSLERWVTARDPISAALHLPHVQDSELKVRRRVAELIELLGLGAYRAKFVQELSTGSRRVVDLAGLLGHRPSVILLDEPSSGIAQREVEALGPMLNRIREQTGASLIVIEHDMPLLRTVSDRLVAMDQGAVICEGLPDEVLADPVVIESYLGPDDTAINRSSTTPSPRP
jgi:branched-chain amino acid transport system ATP-binding protein